MKRMACSRVNIRHYPQKYPFQARGPQKGGALLSRVLTACVVWGLVFGVILGIESLADVKVGGGFLVQPAFAQEQALPQEPPNVARGRLIYGQNCAPCHGETGEGDGPVAEDLPGPATPFADPDVARQSSPADWFEVTKYGRIEQMMPPWEARLSDREIWQTVYYAWSLHLDEAELAQGESRYAESCAACHGPQGAGDGPQAPVDLPRFNDPVYVANASPVDWYEGWQAAHPEIGADWDEVAQYAVLEHMRTFGYVPPWQPVALEGEGVISGRVVMGTPGADLPTELPDGLEVRLETYVDFEPVDSVSLAMDADGTFRFDGLALDPDLVYLVVTGYDGVQYSSPVLSVTPEEPAVETEIMLYARTDDPSDLYTDRVNWVVEPQPEGLLVGQILTFGSHGERTYTGSPIAGSIAAANEGEAETLVTVGFYVPPRAQEIRVENGVLGGRYHQQGELIYDTVPVAPGPPTHQIVVRYFVPYDAEPMTLPNEFIYPVNQVMLLTADLPGIEVNAPGLQSLGVQDFQGADFEVWQGEDLAPGAFPVHFFGLDIAASGTAQVALLQPGMIFGMGGMVTLLLLAAIVVGWRQGRMRPAQEALGLEAQRDYLLQSIARLDDLHAAGVLDEETRQHERVQLKVQLLDVVTRLKALQEEQTQAQQPIMQSEAAIGDDDEFAR